MFEPGAAIASLILQDSETSDRRQVGRTGSGMTPELRWFNRVTV